jgi:hypothetical protein
MVRCFNMMVFYSIQHPDRPCARRLQTRAGLRINDSESIEIANRDFLTHRADYTPSAFEALPSGRINLFRDITPGANAAKPV